MRLFVDTWGWLAMEDAHFGQVRMGLRQVP